MRFYFHKTPIWLTKLYPDLVWSVPSDEKVIYLTFDDGPVPNATPNVLDILSTHNVKATFFVVGENVSKYPETLSEVISGGHQIGNHTYNHLSGWTTSLDTYLANVQKCQEIIDQYTDRSNCLFRPPYGRIRFSQVKAIAETHRIIMWDILSGDFDLKLNPERSLMELRAAQKGSIVVFHDSSKYLHNVKKILPRFLEEMKDQGFKFKVIV